MVKGKAEKGEEKMINKKFIIFGLVIIFVLNVVVAEPLFDSENGGDFEVDSLFLKIAIVEGGGSVNYINVLNKDSTSQDFSVKLNNINNLVLIGQKSFNLGPKTEHSIKVNINAKTAQPGVYVGNLEINSEKSMKQIPIVVEVQTKEVLFDTNINLLKGDILKLGEKLTPQITIFDLASIGRTEVNLEYLVKDFSGKTLISEAENTIVEGKLAYSKMFDLSENLKLGNYILIVSIKYGNSVGTSSLFFKVKEAGWSPSSDFLSNNIILAFLIMFGFFFMIFLIIFAYSILHKDRLLMQLQGQYVSELKKQRELIKQKGRVDYPRLRTTIEKRTYKREVRKVKKQRIKALKEIHKKRVKHFKQVKKKKTIGQLKQQLKKWKQQGYNTSSLETKFKMPKVEDIKKKVNEWKSKGYDTSSLDKKLDKRKDKEK